VAGGGQYFALRGLGDFWSLVAGSALVLDYTLCTALFAYFATTYFSHFVPELAEATVALGPFRHVRIGLAVATLALIAFLAWLNVRGMRQASLLNEVIGVLIILVETLIIAMGLVFAWRPELLLTQWRETFANFHLRQFLYGASLAIISFVGLESISQAAQEPRAISEARVPQSAATPARRLSARNSRRETLMSPLPPRSPKGLERLRSRLRGSRADQCETGAIGGSLGRSR
jgi:APA family basic amino acid/polyamine antiporter